MRTMLLVLVALALLPTIPAATAQVPGVVSLLDQTTTSVVVYPITWPVKPGGVAQAIPISVVYSYFSYAPQTSPTVVELRVTESPPWAVTTITPATLYFQFPLPPCACQMFQQAQAFLLVSATTDAPAFQPGILQVTATAMANGFYMASQGTTSFPVTADFYAFTDARLGDTGIALAPGQTRDLPMSVANFGNGMVRVTFRVEQAPEGVSITPPGPISLESRQTFGKDSPRIASTVAWRVEAEGDFREGDALLRVTTSYALDPDVKGDNLTLPLRIERGDGAGSDGAVRALGLGGSTTSAAALGMGTLFAAAAAGFLHWRRRNPG